MSGKRITMRDIAKEAGVSAAAVSYVLNYSDKEKISHETRMRIFQAANKLKYVPNMTAKSFLNQRSYMVGIFINMGNQDKKSKIYQYYDLVRELQVSLYRKGYDAVLLADLEIEKDVTGKRHSLDTVFIIDMDEERIKEIAVQFFVPTILIDCHIDDPIFCKILTSYESVLKLAEEQLGHDFYVVMEDYADKNVFKTIADKISSNDIFVNRYDADITQFLREHQHQKGLVIGELLGIQVENYVENRNISVVTNSLKDSMLLTDTKTIVVSNKKKAEKAAEIMERLLRLDNPGGVEHIAYILPDL